MSKKKKKAGSKGPKNTQSNAQLKRHYRENNRRKRRMAQKTPGVKEKMISGCMALGLTGALLFFVATTWTCFMAE